MESEAPATGTDQRVAANLKAARERAGLTQRQLAEKMQAEGWTAFRQQTVTRYEGGMRTLTAGEADALARLLGTQLVVVLRPEGLARESWLLLDALRKVIDARDELSHLRRRQSNARDWLEQLVRKARAEGYADQLRQEISAADHALHQEE